MFLRNKKGLEKLAQGKVELQYQAIVKYLANHDAPIDYLISGELAQIQTFGIPSISKLLHRTKQYQNNGLKRLDDTRAILTECMTDSIQSDRGQHMVKHLNWIHSHYEITNDDYLYTLALFIVEPVRWMETFGYRPLTDREKYAGYLAFKSLGQAMGITDIPESRDEFVTWYQSYRDQHLTYHADNKEVTDALINAMKEMFPSILRPLVRPVILTLINDPELLAATGQKAPNKFIQIIIKGFMRVRKVSQRFINPWQNHSFETSYLGQHYKSYPKGYQSNILGPEKIVKNSTAGCPFHVSNL
ncbi:MAG: oxygenase MpaB family protein [Oleispira sp.]